MSTHSSLYLHIPLISSHFSAIVIQFICFVQFRGVDVTTQKEPHIGEQVTITLSSCDQSRNLTPTDPGQCILQIVSQDIINSSPCTSVHVCTLPTSTNTVASSLTQTISELVCDVQYVVTYMLQFIHSYLACCLYMYSYMKYYL